ncbi:MAG: MFS transporter [Acetobacteraceae bacterium]|nr:MFS transporter [Acetobacteraceae bacterium]
MSEPTIVNAGARLDRLPISAFHWRLLGLIGAGGLLDAFDVYLAGGVMAAMVKSGFSDLAHNAVFISATFFGMLVGAGFAGYLGDRFGRRYSYQTNLLIFGVASLAACLAPNIQVLSALRFVMGLGLGAELVVAAGTLCEFIPPAYRGRWISLLGLVINSGLLVATSLGFLVIPHLGWRWMFAIAGAGALVVWVLRKQMPESPRWLESVGRTAEAEVLLARIEAEAAKRGKLPPVDRVQQGVTGRAPLAALFGRDMLGRTLTAALTCVAVNMSVYGFVAWLPTFLVKQGMTIVQSLGFTTLMSFGSTAGALVGLLLADRVSRQFAMVASCVAIAVLGLIYPQLHDGASITVVGFALITAIYTLVTIGLYGYIPELFPTEYRLRGTGVSGMAGRAASITTPYLAVSLFQAFGLQGVLGMVIGILALLVCAVLALRVETGGQALERVSPGAEPIPVGGVAIRRG